MCQFLRKRGQGARQHSGCAAAAVLCLAISAPALAADALISSLDRAKCKVTAIETRDEAGEPLAKSDRYPTAWRCAGIGGRFVHVHYTHQREEIAFGGARRATSRFMRHGHFGSWGAEIEWRGLKGRGGALQATAAIAAYRWDIRGGEDPKDWDVGGDLAVIRIGQGSRDTCIIAWVDLVANPDAMALARKAADEQTARFDCGRDQPAHLGQRRPERAQ